MRVEQDRPAYTPQACWLSSGFLLYNARWHDCRQPQDSVSLSPDRRNVNFCTAETSNGIISARGQQPVHACKQMSGTAQTLLALTCSNMCVQTAVYTAVCSCATVHAQSAVHDYGFGAMARASCLMQTDASHRQVLPQVAAVQIACCYMPRCHACQYAILDGRAILLTRSSSHAMKFCRKFIARGGTRPEQGLD